MPGTRPVKTPVTVPSIAEVTRVNGSAVGIIFSDYRRFKKTVESKVGYVRRQ